MARKATIRPSKLPAPPSRKDRLAKAKACRVLRAELQTRPAPDVDPVEFARAFRPFREDMDLLSEDDQHNFQKLLRGFLLGKVDHEMWRRAVNALSELKRAHIPPLPKNYWKRCV